VLALVIVPPWIMDLEPRPVTTDLKVEIPTQDSNRLKPPAVAAKTPESVPAPPQPESAAEPKPPAADKAKPAAAKSAKKTETVARVAPAAKTADAKRAEAILNAEGFVVQLGVFADKENAKKLETRLGKAGVKHYSESLSGSGGEQIRVRAGPYPTRESAEQAREQLKEMGLAPGPVIARQ
jgi:DedD protein